MVQLYTAVDLYFSMMAKTRTWDREFNLAFTIEFNLTADATESIFWKLISD